MWNVGWTKLCTGGCCRLQDRACRTDLPSRDWTYGRDFRVVTWHQCNTSATTSVSLILGYVTYLRVIKLQTFGLRIALRSRSTFKYDSKFVGFGEDSRWLGAGSDVFGDCRLRQSAPWADPRVLSPRTVPPWMNGMMNHAHAASRSQITGLHLNRKKFCGGTNRHFSRAAGTCCVHATDPAGYLLGPQAQWKEFTKTLHIHA